MKNLFKAVIMAAAIMPAVAFSHGAPRITVTEEVTINAAPEKVWEAIKDFDNLHAWLPPIKSTKASGGNEVGATRTLTTQSDSTIDETLKKFDNDKMSMMYAITAMSTVGEVDDHGEMHEIPAVPVSKYKAWLSVKAVDGGSKVTWKAKFFRAYHGKGHPPVELDDKAAKNAITGIFKSGLDNLKMQLEK